MRAVGVSMIGALVALAVTCSSASALTGTELEPGVHVDPGSPAAKEYALPLNQARQTGARPASHERSPEAALFGAGIDPPGSGGSKPPGSHPRGARGLPPGAAVTGSSGSAALPSAVVRATQTQTSSGGDGSVLALLAGGVAIIVLGGFGGTVLRHSRRPTPSG
jgi:hypothetical protein